MRRHIRFVIATVVSGLICISAAYSNEILAPPTVPVGKELFSLNLINLEYGVGWPTVPFASWRNFHSVWAKLEPNKGQWQFEQLDKDVALAGQNGVDVMLALQSTPTWASARPNEMGCCTPQAAKGNAAEAKDMDDWCNYVRTVATRYKGRVRYYELWNEPNVKRFYSGDIEHLVALNRAAYTTLKAIDPQITVVSSSLSPCCESLAYLNTFLAKGGGLYADAISYHFYVAPKPPEAMLQRIAQVKELMKKHAVNKPLWNTESGWRIINSDKNIKDEQWAGAPLSTETAAAYVVRSYILSWAAGVERLYWYAWGHRSMGMTEYDGKTPKSIATAYSETRKWLVGSRMMGCRTDNENTWSCEITRDGGYRGRILWNPDKKITVGIGDFGNAMNWRDLDGVVHPLNGVQQLEVGASPILIESMTR